MSQNKRNRVSHYAPIDESFTYNPTENYNSEDFLKLSITKLQSIASSLYLRNVKRYKKEQLVPVLLQKHKDTQNHGVNELEVYDAEPSKNDDGNLLNELCQFQQIIYNSDTWFQANHIANFLEYKNSRRAIIDLVDSCNKISYEELCTNGILSNNRTGVHPDTIFINEKGVTQLMHRSRMPLATGKKRGLEEVYVATTAIYEEKGVYKIGKADSSTKRIKNMNTGRSPDDDMYLCYVAQCYDALKAEKLIHSALHAYRIAPNREFFKHSLVEIKNVVDTVCSDLKHD